MVTQDQGGDLQRQIEEMRALIQAAEARAEKERREKEDAQAQAEKDRREREAAQAQAEKDRREREAAQAQAEKDRREKEAAQAQAEKESREKEAAQAKAEKERREKEEERHDKELLQQELNLTTLHEYLRNCHNHLYKNLHLSPKSHLTTGNTSVTGKFYPKVLLPWAGFETDIVPRHFPVIEKICGDAQAFPQRNVVVHMWKAIANRGDDHESFIKSFQTVAVDYPVMHIIQFAASREDFRTRYDTTRVCFSQRLSEVSQPDVAPSDNKASEASREQRVVLAAMPKPDNIGMRTRNNGDKCLAFVYDYKAPHKVDATYVRQALAKTNLFAEVIQRINCPRVTTDDAVRHREDAEASIATSLVHLYDYMVTFGVEFGYVAAGSTLLLLYVDRNDPQTLFCHPCMPLDLSDQIDGTIDLSRTAVAQMLCFCLQSFQTDARPGSDRSLDAAFVRTVTSVKTWPVPYMDAPRAGLESPASTTDTSFQSMDDSELMSMKMVDARRTSLRSHSSSKPGGVLPRRDDDHKDDEDGEGGLSRSGKISPSDALDDASTRQYCTQACLLGLQRGHDLDENCPNVMLHRDGCADVSRHPLNAGQFADLMGQQLRRDPYHKCSLVNFWTKGGAMGWMFKLELLPYGYTLVGKGTVAGRRSRLEHEGRIYERLSSLQGHLVPVHLGLVNMGRGYIIPGFRFVVHMMLMSWAGERPDDAADKTMVDAKRVSLKTMWHAGVDHGDDCTGNYVWSAERRCIMIIDFDHARLLPMPKPKAVDALARPKRKRGVKAGGARKRRARAIP